jgi:hypothetical protein
MSVSQRHPLSNIPLNPTSISVVIDDWLRLA